MTPESQARRVRTATRIEPKQKRSRRTMERILSATEELLRERPFEQISIAEIVRRARSSVGAFYARFSNKEALLPALYERYDAALQVRWSRPAVTPAVWEDMSLTEKASFMVKLLLHRYRENLWLMRAIALFARTHPDALGEDLLHRRAAMHRSIAAAFLGHVHQMTHPRPRRAIELGLFMAAATLREKILFGGAPHARVTEVSDRELLEEVTRSFLSYLGAVESPGTGESRPNHPAGEPQGEPAKNSE